MKRTIAAAIPALLISFSLLFSACAPSRSMIATLTQLPFAGTPPTPTPYPTFTPRPSGTPTPGPAITEGVGNGPTSTVSAEQPTLDGTVAAALTLAALPTKTSAVTETPPAEGTPTAAVASRCTSVTYDTSIPEPNASANYLGRHYDDRNLPQGMRWVASGMLASDSYSWAHVQVQNQDVYWIEKLVCQDANGQPYWEIADALILPALNTQAHEVAVNLCFEGGQQIPYAIAYGTYDPSKPAEQVMPNFTGWPLQLNGAWQMKDKFVPLTSQSLICMLQETQGNQ